MIELIDRYAALEKMCNDCKSGYDGHCPHPFGMCHEYESILQVPTIEPEVRRGHWMFLEQKRGYLWKCSNCKGNFDQQFSYCPHCGAVMEG